MSPSLREGDLAGRSRRRSLLSSWRVPALALAVVLVAAIGVVAWQRSTGNPEPTAADVAVQTPRQADPVTGPTPSPTLTPITSSTHATRKAPAKPKVSASRGTSGGSGGSPSPAGWPGAGNTGVPAGVKLRTMGDVSLNKTGEVLSGAHVKGCVTVNARNVVIKNSLIEGTCDTIVTNNSTNLTIQDTEIDGLTSDSVALGFANFTAKRIEIRHIGDGVRANGNIVMTDSWIHSFISKADTHNDGVQVTEGSGVVIEHNRIENQLEQTSAVMIGADQGPVSDITIRDNLLAGGGYALYGGKPREGADPSSVTGIKLIDNRFSTTFFPQGGAFGAIAYQDFPGCVSQGNTMVDGTPV